jgi:hypothetical protein
MFLNFKLKIFQGFLSIGEHRYNEKIIVQTMLPNKDNTFLCLNLIFIFKPKFFLVLSGFYLFFIFRVKSFGTVFKVLKMRQNYSLRIQKEKKLISRPMFKLFLEALFKKP